MSDINEKTLLDPTTSGGGGGGGPFPASSILYTNTTPTPVGHGGISSGTIFNNESVQKLFDVILYPPSFSSFSISGQANPLEVGDNIPAAVTFIWGTLNPANIQANSLIIRDVTNAVDLATGLADDGTEAIVQAGAITKTVRDSHVYRISGVDILTGVLSRDVTYDWVWRRYWGKSSLTGPITEAQLEALANNPLIDGYATTFSFPTSVTPEYMYITYASTLGTASSFIDAETGLSVPFETVYTVSVTNSFGQTVNYNVHRSTNPTAGAVNIIVA